MSGADAPVTLVLVDHASKRNGVADKGAVLTELLSPAVVCEERQSAGGNSTGTRQAPKLTEPRIPAAPPAVKVLRVLPDPLGQRQQTQITRVCAGTGVHGIG
jgi:hypothetical protein